MVLGFLWSPGLHIHAPPGGGVQIQVQAVKTTGCYNYSDIGGAAQGDAREFLSRD